MDTYTESKLDTFVLVQTGMQVFHRSEDTQTRSYCSLSVIFMGVGIAKVHEESIPQKLRNVSSKAGDDLRTDLLVRTDHVPIVFGIKLRREFSRVHQVAEYHGQLTTFRVG
jgi:hypothetical protein